MNQLTLLYVNQADREREIGEDLRNRQILSDDRLRTDPARLVPENRQASANPRPASVRARATGR